MGFLYLSFLAIIQGITEFLPVSSSGHLLLIAEMSKNKHHNLQVDIAVHFGSLLAVILYYRREMSILIRGFYKNIRLDFSHQDSNFFQLILIATIPVVLLGFFLKLSGLIDSIRSPKVVAFGMIFFGLILYFADRFGAINRKESEWTAKDAFFMGLCQALALIPGTSRSGNTITGARMLGFCRQSSINLSMIMSVPTILASTVILFWDVIGANAPVDMSYNLISAACLSFLAAYGSIKLLILFGRSRNFTPFVIYRVLLGAIIFIVLYQ